MTVRDRAFRGNPVQHAANLLTQAASALLTWPAPRAEEKATTLVLCARAMQLVAESDQDEDALRLAEQWCQAEVERRRTSPDQGDSSSETSDTRGDSRKDTRTHERASRQ